MATKKAAGSAKNLRDSNPKYLGLKLHDGEIAKIGSIIVRQRGTAYLPGKNVKLGRDFTIYSMIDGKVKFTSKRKIGFNNQLARKPVVSVLPLVA